MITEFNVFKLPLSENILFTDQVARTCRSQGWTTRYCARNRTIEVLHTSDLPSETLQEILKDLSPVISTERTSEGNLQVKLRPKHTITLEGFLSQKPLGASELLLRDPPDLGSLFGNSEMLRCSYTVDCSAAKLKQDMEEQASMEELVASNVIGVMEQFVNRHRDDSVSGIWYPHDYEQHLKEQFNIEMNPSFHDGFANEQFFEKTGRFSFSLKPGVKPSEALLSFLEGPTVADCGNVTAACYYKCALDILGEEKFNTLFTLFPLTITQRWIIDSSLRFLGDYTPSAKRELEGSMGRRPLRRGEECHFDGVIWYANKHPLGFGGGMNVLCVGNNERGEQLFLGHGFEKPMTEREMNVRFIEEYNQERSSQDEAFAGNGSTLPYNRKTNVFLRNHYTISQKVAEENPKSFLRGFLIASCRGLRMDKLVHLQKAETTNDLIAAFIGE